MRRHRGDDLTYRFVADDDQSVVGARDDPTSIGEDAGEPHVMTRERRLCQGRDPELALQLNRVQLPFEIRRAYQQRAAAGRVRQFAEERG